MLLVQDCMKYKKLKVLMTVELYLCHMFYRHHYLRIYQLDKMHILLLYLYMRCLLPLFHLNKYIIWASMLGFVLLLDFVIHIWIEDHMLLPMVYIAFHRENNYRCKIDNLQLRRMNK